MRLTRTPDSLHAVGFRGCEHPLVEVTPLSLGRSLTVRYCLTCGAALSDSRGWRLSQFGMSHGINYELLTRHSLLDYFAFWIRQRPESRVFGDI